MIQTVKNPPANAGDMGSIPGWGISPGEGSGKPFQYSCLGNSVDRGGWWAIVHGFAAKESDIDLATKQQQPRNTILFVFCFFFFETTI